MTYLPDNYCSISDEKSSGTNGGVSTAGSWQTRTLNTILDTNTGITISSNQMIIPAGTYEIFITQPFHGVLNRANSRLYNITDSSLVLNGSSICSTAGGTTFHSFISGRFILTAQKTLEVQYQVQTAAGAAQDLGFSSGGIFAVGAEVYTQVRIHKII